MLLTFVSLILDSGVIPPGSGAFAYFAAAQNGLTSALCVCLLINGFVGFQLYEDGTTLSVWLLRSVSFAMFIITGLISLATFKSWAGLGPTHTVGLFIVLYVVSGIELLVYGVMQTILVVNTLQDRWPLGDIAFGAFFLIIGQVILYVFSNTICNAVQHYLDGLFFATICNLLAVMMVYKVHTPIPSGPLMTYANIKLVLGFHHPRRSRILRGNQAKQLGSEGTSAGGRPQKYVVPRREVPGYGLRKYNGVQLFRASREGLKLRGFCILSIH
jgi:predicted small integral membrane protein